MPPNYQAMAASYAQQYGVPQQLFLNQIKQESGFNPSARSGAGALGIAQFMPGTAQAMGVNPMDPKSALQGAARLMSQNYAKYGSWARALSAYNSGRPDAYTDPHFANGQTYNYVKDIMSGAKIPATGSPGRATTLTSTAPSTPGATAPSSSQQALAAIMLQQSAATAQGQSDPGSLLALAFARQQLQAAHQVYGPSSSSAPAAPQQGGAAPIKGFKMGVPVADLTSRGGEHQTEGLPGYPAYDYFAPSGSTTVAPVGGKVVKLSGHDPSQGPVEGPHGPLGWSVYIQGTDGHTYYLTHMGSRSVQLGQTVKPGQAIGTVANYAKYGTPSHIHMGVH